MTLRKTSILIAALLATAATCSAQNPAPVPPGAVVERDLVYAQAGEKKLVLDLYLPEKRPPNLPVVVWVYGGAWRSRNRTPQAPKASWLATHGYAVAVIDYRLSSEALFPAQINDCKAAVRWLRANAAKYGLDGGRIGAWGESSGGISPRCSASRWRGRSRRRVGPRGPVQPGAGRRGFLRPDRLSADGSSCPAGCDAEAQSTRFAGIVARRRPDPGKCAKAAAPTRSPM